MAAEFADRADFGANADNHQGKHSWKIIYNDDPERSPWSSAFALKSVASANSAAIKRKTGNDKPSKKGALMKRAPACIASAIRD
jgi:hypothetical protein